MPGVRLASPCHFDLRPRRADDRAAEHQKRAAAGLTASSRRRYLVRRAPALSRQGVAGRAACRCRRTREGGSHMSERSRHGVWMAMAVAAGLSLAVSSVRAQSPPANKVQLKCQTGTAKATATFVKSKLKCAQKCLANARKTSGPYTGCVPPDFTDPKTNTCILDPEKGAEAKARAKIDKGCAADCPACYAGFCPDSTPLVDAVEGELDFIGVQIYCREAGGESPTKAEAKCEDAVGKSLAKFVGVKAKCFQNCITREFKGKIPAN